VLYNQENLFRIIMLKQDFEREYINFQYY